MVGGGGGASSYGVRPFQYFPRGGLGWEGFALCRWWSAPLELHRVGSG